MRRPARARNGGFTLLEVMIAMVIMTMAFSAILTSQSGSIQLTIKTKEMNIAGWLARNKMVESEHLYEGKAFDELPKGPEIKKFDAPFERYSWKREIREIKFPDITQQAAKSDKEGGIPEAVRILAKTMTKYLNNAVRELVITVSWPRGDGEQEMTVTTYLIDLNAEFNFGI
jgi:general secretion pathway protein I